MKRKTLTTAVMAGLTGMAGMMSVANAVNVNPDGLGQVLLYPYYTTRGGNDTLISVVNTTSNAKSVKIRFLEGRNSREVLDFNIYLSPFDVWTGSLTEQPGPTPEESGTYLLTRDTTCTVPYFYGESEARGDDPVVGMVDFKDFEFIAFPPPVDVDNTDGGGSDLERVQSGYFEIIEMGTLVDDATDPADPLAPTIARDSATAVTHVDGVPADCQQLVDAWTPRETDQDRPFDADSYFLTGNEADQDDFPGFSALVDHEDPSGGLFGAAAIVNIDEGTLLSYNAEAIDNWTERVAHTNPGSTLPSIVEGSVDTSAVFISGSQTVDQQVWNTPREAVNAILTNNEVMNEYAINPLVGGKTEWVVTFPTKRFHVDPALVTDAINPFSVVFGSDDQKPGSCEPVTFRLWDREEGELREEAPGSGGVIPSPRPPGFTPEPETFDLCWEANVIRFVDEDTDVPGNTEILGENRFSTIPLPIEEDENPISGFFAGWMKLDFSPEAIEPALGFPADARRISSLNGVDYVGLPVIGFEAQTVTNNTRIVDGERVLSNFGGTFKHRGTRRIEVTPADPTSP